jgi:hypothetical protein
MHRLVSGGRRPTLLVGRRLLRLSQQRSVSIPAAATLANGRGRVAVAMSGGIDSAVTAVLLQEAGYDCVGVFMKNWDDADESASGSKCDSSEDLKDMQEVCQRLGISAYNVRRPLSFDQCCFTGWCLMPICYLSSHRSLSLSPRVYHPTCRCLLARWTS